MRVIKANESVATRRRVYFQIVSLSDGMTPAIGEGGGQPQISTNGGAWTNTGISTLTAIGFGRYYAELTQEAVSTQGDVIETRFKSSNTAECPGDTIQVWRDDPAQSYLAETGAGSTETTVTIDDGSGGPLDGVDVWVATDSGGAYVVARGTTNDAGEVTLWLDPGDYYVFAQRAGFSALSAQPLTVS